MKWLEAASTLVDRLAKSLPHGCGRMWFANASKAHRTAKEIKITKIALIVSFETAIASR
jgi:hypothetical protein